MSDFKKVQELDTPELVAARWWKTAEPSGAMDVSRRGALLGLAGLAAATALSNTGCGGGSNEPSATKAMELQKASGWDFGAEGKALDMGPGVTNETVNVEVAKNLANSLKPTNLTHIPFANLTLFDAMRVSTAASKNLVEAIRPIHTPSMENAELSGRGLSVLFEKAPPGKAILVDLPGPEAVAFAAGLANRFDPVFIMDNWPHPNGTVPSHLTLAAAIDRLGTFQQLAGKRPNSAPPAFILDSNRLNTFSDSQFDNRYVANLPSGAALKKLGIKEVLMVRPKATDAEMDDQNETVLDWLKQGIAVKQVPLDSFKQVPPDKSSLEYGPAVAQNETDVDLSSSSVDPYRTTHRYTSHNHYAAYGAHFLFWSHYGWGRSAFRSPTSSFRASSYSPTRRSTSFGRNKSPTGFGQVDVVRNGSKTSLSRSQSKSAGSWGRGRSGGYG